MVFVSSWRYGDSMGASGGNFLHVADQGMAMVWERLGGRGLWLSNCSLQAYLLRGLYSSSRLCYRKGGVWRADADISQIELAEQLKATFTRPSSLCNNESDFWCVGYNGSRSQDRWFEAVLTKLETQQILWD